MILLQQGRKLALTLLVGLCLAMTLLCVCFNTMAAVGIRPFHNKSIVIATERYPTRLTPTGWTPGVWSFIYVCLIVINLHLFACRFWKPAVHHLDDSGRPWPHVGFYALWICMTIVDIVRLVIWDADIIGAASGTTALLFVLSAIVWFELSLTLRESAHTLDHFRVFVKNGLGLYAGWITYDTAATLCAAIMYDGGLTEPDQVDIAAIISLLFLTITFVMFAVLDFVFLRFTKQVYAAHMGFIWGILGILSTQAFTYSVIYAACLGAGMLIVLLVKVGICLSKSLAR